MNRWWINADADIGSGDVVYIIREYPEGGPHKEVYYDLVWLSRDGGPHVYFHSETAIQSRGSPHDPIETKDRNDYRRVVRGLFEGKVHQK